LLGATLLTATLFSCSINADVFSTWLASDLLPKLTQPSLIVMDNASFHKRADCKILIEQAGHTLLFLPPYSPDFNPIEHKWAQAKAKRRKLAVSVEELFAVLF
jgi:transposase